MPYSPLEISKTIEFLLDEKNRCLIYLKREPEIYEGIEENIKAFDIAISSLVKAREVALECRNTITRLENHNGYNAPASATFSRIDASIFAYKNILRILEE